MAKITIAFANLQSGVATTKGYFHYLYSWWKYWLPHSNKPLRDAGLILKNENVDLAFFVEVSEKSLATGYRSQIKIVSECSGLPEKKLFFPPRFSIRPHEGKGIISRHEIKNAICHKLKGGILPRYLAEAVVTINDQDITVFVAHLPLERLAREGQIDEIIGIIKSRKGPLILAGDFNENDSGLINKFTQQTPLEHMYSKKCFPSWKPNRSIDYILLSKEFSETNCHIPQGPLFSDHLPIIVTAEII